MPPCFQNLCEFLEIIFLINHKIKSSISVKHLFREFSQFVKQNKILQKYVAEC